jgi:hypothetical protein
VHVELRGIVPRAPEIRVGNDVVCPFKLLPSERGGRGDSFQVRRKGAFMLGESPMDESGDNAGFCVLHKRVGEGHDNFSQLIPSNP